MSDWRSQPRNGRSQILPLLADIKKRLATGETQKMIFDSYPEIAMSYAQFTRYVKKYCIDELKQLEPETVKTISESIVTQPSEPARKKVRNPADLKRVRTRPIDLEELQNSAGDKDESSNS